MNAATALRLLATTQMREFTETDWDAFAGCKSEHPLIGEAAGYTLIVDGRHLGIVNEHGEEAGYQLESLA